MQFLKDRLHEQEKHFEKGGKFERLYPLFEAGYSILFSTKKVVSGMVHLRDSLDTKRYMSIVLLALMPCLFFGIYNTGYQAHLASGSSLDLFSVVLTGLKYVMPLVLVSYVVGGIWETLFAVFRKHEINEGFLVTGLLYPLSLPPDIPLWMAAVGISFGVVIGKEVFGGTGKNFLNPALTARAFVFFTYPAYISGEVWTALEVTKDKLVDGYSGATALAVAASASKSMPVTEALVSAGFTLKSLFLGLVPGSIGETSALCVLIGAAILIITGVGSWRTMVSGVIGLTAMSAILMFFSNDLTLSMFDLSPIWHMVMGSFAFGIVFMATDPVSSPSLNESKWVYGFFIGVLAVIIRTVNPAYPEGMMLAILLMNVFAPLIDHVYVEKRVKVRIPNVI
jgi:Na+-transporting NADH:ubiquinone oxidoreductase subunit B